MKGYRRPLLQVGNFAEENLLDNIMSNHDPYTFTDELFTWDESKSGAIILHIIGNIIYTWIKYNTIILTFLFLFYRCAIYDIWPGVSVQRILHSLHT